MFHGEEALDAGGVKKVCYQTYLVINVIHGYVSGWFQVIFLGEEAVDEGGVRKVGKCWFYCPLTPVDPPRVPKF